MRCMECGGALTETMAPITMDHHGESITVEGIAHLQCEGCGAEEFPMGSLDELAARFDAEYRRRHGLLSLQDIRALRKSLGLTQEEFQEVLGVGMTTVSRWETRKVIQPKPEDNLMRAMRDHAEVAADMMERAGFPRPAGA